MTTLTIPTAMSVRLRDEDRAAITTIATAVVTPHCAAVTVTDALRTALVTAADTVRGREGTAVA